MNDNQKDKDLMLGVILTTIVLVLAATFLIFEGKDVTQLTPFLGVLVPILFNSRSINRQTKEIARMREKVDTVDRNVNGHLTDLSIAAGIKDAPVVVDSALVPSNGGTTEPKRVEDHGTV